MPIGDSKPEVGAHYGGTQFGEIDKPLIV